MQLMATVMITGGTGMIGTQLTTMLTEKGYQVIILTRKLPIESHPNSLVSFALWDVERQTIDQEVIQKTDHIIHLAGAGVADKRWSKKRKQEIVDSRTMSSALIVKALHEYSNKVKTVVSASAIGWYGPDTPQSLKHAFTEEAVADKAYLGETCRLWEESIAPVSNLGKRLVRLRTGIVLSKTGGALSEFIKPLKAGIAAILGSGKQVISWIHVNDLCSLFIYALEQEKMEGTYNAVAPHPVTNKQLTLTLAKIMRKSFYIPIYVPAFILKIMLGELSIEVLKSANVSTHKTQLAGFDFKYPTIESALSDLSQ